MTTNTVLIYISICRSFRIFQPRDDFSIIPAETKRKMQYMVMTIEWTYEKFILSYKAQGNDNVINLYNTRLRTAYQFPLLFGVPSPIQHRNSKDLSEVMRITKNGHCQGEILIIISDV